MINNKMKASVAAAIAAITFTAGQASATVYDLEGNGDVLGVFLDVTGTWDDVTGMGNWTSAIDASAGGLGFATVVQDFNLDATTGIGNLIAGTCTGDASTCSIIGANHWGSLVSSSAPVGAGSHDWTAGFQVVGNVLFDVTLTPQGSEVPVPAAAWLFGSALIGLVGIGRSRTSAA